MLFGKIDKLAFESLKFVGWVHYLEHVTVPHLCIFQGENASYLYFGYSFMVSWFGRCLVVW